MLDKQVHIVVYGKVQGVFFRAYTETKAQELGICGRVKNLENGSVDIIAQGPEESLKRLVEWCHEGPSGAQVEKVTVDWLKVNGKFLSFHIEY
ncbi:MAG: acylphosphatase [Deltaproteobacteria bacterium]|nr:acylphosphatase [Deltaproteobacteria bacterium]